MHFFHLIAKIFAFHHRKIVLQRSSYKDHKSLGLNLFKHEGPHHNPSQPTVQEQFISEREGTKGTTEHTVKLNKQKGPAKATLTEVQRKLKAR